MEGFLYTDPEQLLEKTLSHAILWLCCPCLWSYQRKTGTDLRNRLYSGCCITPGTWVLTCGADQVLLGPPALCTDRVRVGPGWCRGGNEMAETLQSVVTASVRPWQPLSLIQDGANGVSPAQGLGLRSTLVDKKDKHVCSLLVQNSLL